jgi:hypothetical protein
MNSIEVTGLVSRALDQLRISWMIVGAFSSNAYGIGRSTNDADFVVELSKGDLTRLMEILGPEFSLNRQMQLEGITGSVRNVITYLPNRFQIELFRLNPGDDHDRTRFERRQRLKLGETGQEVWLPTAEDVVIQKLRWQRRKDLDDIVGILAVSGAALDWNYLIDWARKHGTTELLKQLAASVSDLNLPSEFSGGTER